MTPDRLLAAILPIVNDLAQELPDSERFRRLLHALRVLVPCDAIALLRLDKEYLIPLAAEGLHAEVMGRRFRVNEHPRFAALLQVQGSTRFPLDCPLPDPYDGLIDATTQSLNVHDCMGCPIVVDGRTWGLVTLDALDSARFHEIDVQKLDAFTKLIAVAVKTCDRFNVLNRRIEDEHLLAERYLEAASRVNAHVLAGNSAAFRTMLGEIQTVAGSDLTVLVSGETGTGKELVAQTIHARSSRAQRPMVNVNCAALPDSLIESELFGHVRGAFSGAVGNRSGKFQLADGGTLFLDEVGELPLAVQAKLLRVLQSGQLQRVGSDQEIRVDVRVITATNRDLAEEVRKGRFRADLYHRISVYPLSVPPLRERGRDVLLLAGNFLEQNRSRLHLRSLRLAPAAQAPLLAHQWPGNVRELEHLIGRAALKARADAPGASSLVTIDIEHLDLPKEGKRSDVDTLPATPIQTGVSLREAVDHYQAILIQSSLDRHKGNWAASARELGLDRGNLRRLAVRLNLREPKPSS